MNDFTNIEPWVGIKTVATHLGVNPDTVRKLIRENRIPHHRIGKLWKFQITEVDEWVRSGAAVEGK